MKTLLLAAVAAIALGSSAQAATISPVVEYTSASTLTDSRPFTLGYDFLLSSALSVNALGYWDNGRSGSHQVGIWDSANNLVASATVQATDQVVGHFRWASISAVLLGPGAYTIGGEFLGDGTFNSFATGIVSNPAFTYVTDRQTFGSGLNRPTFSTGGSYGQNGILEVSFSSTAVPEPATWAMMIAGFGIAGASLRRRRVLAKAA